MRYGTRVVTDAEAIGLLAARRLREASRCDIGPGLNDAEFDRVEAAYGFEFADDHRAFLAAGLPLNSGLPAAPPGVTAAHPRPWPDWRGGEPDGLRASLGRPVEGALFDVRHNRLWLPEWGARPADPDAAVETAGRRLATVPRMVPVYGHRYLPAGRGGWGHPVLSIWQTDIAYYGADLADWVAREFGGTGSTRRPRATVGFWSRFLRAQ